MEKKSFKRYVEQEWGQLALFMVYAVLEWVMIVLLFIDGFLVFVANEFAMFFEMKIPCLVCTRIDHLLVHRDAHFYYNDSICETHKKDVSYLAYCHVHKKLSDIRRMCEGCLLSFATEKESDCDTYKSLVGILHKNIEVFVDDDREVHLTLPAGIKDDPGQNAKSSIHCCSCCGEPLKVKPQSKGKKTGLLSQAPAPSPRAPFRMTKSESSRTIDLAQIRCKELKFSDCESEFQNDDDGSSTFRQAREDAKVATTVPLVLEAEDMNEDRTPSSARGNKFFGIPLTDSANVTPRWATRIPRKSPLEKVEYGSEAAEGTVSNEADGDSMLSHWSWQIRLKRKSLIDLCMELDEERNASAVAANNAMAMITRLQQEKAAVQMEALQYQRMMEEEAEYYEEDLQATKDFLDKKEEEISVLEAELDTYRAKYGTLTEEAFLRTGNVVNEDYQGYTSRGGQNKHENGDINDQSLSSQEDKGEEKPDKSKTILQEGKSESVTNGHNNDQSSSSREEKGREKPEESKNILQEGRSETVTPLDSSFGGQNKQEIEQSNDLSSSSQDEKGREKLDKSDNILQEGKAENATTLSSSLEGQNKQENGHNNNQSSSSQEDSGGEKPDQSRNILQEGRSESLATVLSSPAGQDKQENGQYNDQSSSSQEQNGGGEKPDKPRNSLQEEKKRRLGRLKNLDKKSQLSSENLNPSVEEIERGNKTRLMRDLTHINERVNALQKDDGFLTQANGSGRAKLLSEISENLQKLFHSVTMSYDGDQDA